MATLGTTVNPRLNILSNKLGYAMLAFGVLGIISLIYTPLIKEIMAIFSLLFLIAGIIVLYAVKMKEQPIVTLDTDFQPQRIVNCIVCSTQTVGVPMKFVKYDPQSKKEMWHCDKCNRNAIVGQKSPLEGIIKKILNMIGNFQPPQN